MLPCTSTATGSRRCKAAIAIVVQASHLFESFYPLRDRNYFYRSILDRMEPRMPERREPLSQEPAQFLGVIVRMTRMF